MVMLVIIFCAIQPGVIYTGLAVYMAHDSEEGIRETGL